MQPVILIDHDPEVAPPPPWQTGWARGPAPWQFRCMTAGAVARAPAGTPIPDGAKPYTRPVVHVGMRLSAAAELREALATRTDLDSLRREVLAGLLEDEAGLEDAIRLALGDVNRYALFAPLEVETAGEAAHLIVQAEDEWDSRCSCAVIRVAPGGYHAWVGVGGTMRQVGGVLPSYEDAEAAVVLASAAERAATMQRVRAILAGWSGDTPFYSATLETAAAELPLAIRRGPATAAEAGSSWDLPVYAVAVGGVVTERRPEVIRWDDDASRAAAEARVQTAKAKVVRR